MRIGDRVRFRDDGRVGRIEQADDQRDWVIVRLPNGAALIGPRASFEPVGDEQAGQTSEGGGT